MQGRQFPSVRAAGGASAARRRCRLLGFGLLALAPRWGDACQNVSGCNAGCYSTPQGCLQCNAGLFSEANATECSICPPGSFSQAESSECSPCPPGRYAFAESSSCDDCPAGAGSGSTASGGQCGIDLCGHTCNEAVLHIHESADNTCEWTWADGCLDEDPPSTSPFSRTSTLEEMCPGQCASVNNTGDRHFETPDNRFVPVDGGNNVACRGRDSSDNADSNYEVTEEAHMTFRACREMCVAHENCTGIEFKQFWGGTTRCEVWVVPILATVSELASMSLHGFLCLRYTPDSTTLEVSGSWRRALPSAAAAASLVLAWAVL